MERAATTPRLKQAFADHLEETQQQVERLKEVFDREGSVSAISTEGRKATREEHNVKELTVKN